MKIAYFGGDMFYSCMELFLTSGHELIALFIDERRTVELALSQHVRHQAEIHGVPIIRSKPTNAHIVELQERNCDMILSGGYPHKIPPWQGGSIKYAINIHPSLLPEGAGPLPLPLVIIKGLQKTGVTLHELSPQWDAGNIVLQESFPLSGRENIDYLLCKSQELAVRLLKCFLESPETYWANASPQIHKQEDYWPMPTPEELSVDFTKDIKTVDSRLRTLRIVKPNGDVEFVSSVMSWEQVHNLAPGSVISHTDKTYIIAAGNGVVLFHIEELFHPQQILESKVSKVWDLP